MKIAITGGTGFVGRQLAQEHLRRGDTVKILTRKDPEKQKSATGLEIVQGDLAEQNSQLTSFVNNADILYHCAAELNRPGKMYATHITGAKNLLQAATGRVGRWVQLSSVGVYGHQRQGKITEKTPLRPQGQYEITKSDSDELVSQVCSKENFDYAILRPSNIYGPDMVRSYLFQIIKLIDYGLYCFIGRPGARANYIHLDNVVEALICCGQSRAAVNRVFNLSDWLTMEEFIGIIAKELKRREPVIRLPEGVARLAAKVSAVFPGFPLTPSRVDALTLRSWYPTDKIEKELGYSHPVTMDQGLARMVQVYKMKNR